MELAWAGTLDIESSMPLPTLGSPCPGTNVDWVGHASERGNPQVVYGLLSRPMIPEVLALVQLKWR